MTTKHAVQPLAEDRIERERPLRQELLLGDRLKSARRGSGLSLRALQARVHGLVSAQADGKYERGQMSPRPRMLLALAQALAISADSLLDRQWITAGRGQALPLPRAREGST